MIYELLIQMINDRAQTRVVATGDAAQIRKAFQEKLRASTALFGPATSWETNQALPPNQLYAVWAPQTIDETRVIMMIEEVIDEMEGE